MQRFSGGVSGDQSARESRLRPVRYEPMAIERERFYPVPPNLLAEIAAERLTEEAKPRPLPEFADVPPPPELELWELGDLEMPGEGEETSKAFGTREDSLPGLEELQLETVRMRAEELEEYARLWIPDADVTDAASRDRQLGRQIVLAAVEAMGGMEALLEIRDMRYQGRYHKSYGPRSRYAHMLPGGARLIYDGQRGWIDLFGEPYPLEGKSFREVQRRAERWDFLSRYLGSGIRLTYLGTRRPRGGPARHIVQVEDLKYGGSFRAHFEKDSKLLVTDEYVDKRGPYLHVNYLDYGSTKRAFVWQTIERHLLRVMRFARSQYPVSYRDIPDSLFITSKPDTSWVRLETHKSEATLWVEVQMTNAGIAGKPVLPGGTGRLTGWQKEMLAKQVERLAIDDLRRWGSFGQVKPCRDAESRTDMAEGDFLLRLIVYSEDPGPPGGPSPPIYQAQLFEVTSMHLLMQDGPPSGEYTKTHLECAKYGFGAHTIDESGVYGSQEKISTLIRSTSMKVADSVNAYREGLREHLPHADDCCYCKEP